MSLGGKSGVIIAVVVGFTCVVVGVLIGYFSRKPDATDPAYLAAVAEANTDLSQKLIDEVDKENIRLNHRLMASEPHMAGTEQDKVLAEKIRQTWLLQGLDWVKFTPYTVMLNYPDASKPKNQIQVIRRSTGEVLYETQTDEPPLPSDADVSRVVPPFNAYSASQSQDDANFEVVYANYGRVEDFEHLATIRGLNLVNKVFLIRYGHIFRGSKVREAMKVGGKGVIFYSDPADYAQDGPESVYPNTWWMPDVGVQRGTLNLGGDYLTPGYPSNDAGFRIDVDKANMPNIPVHPISYRDAYNILSLIGGSVDVPTEWQGGMNFTYKIHNEASDIRIRMFVHNKNVQQEVNNVIGAIRGAVEPDRYVIVGNHYDAWTFGGADPSSGTAVMLELTRVLGKMLKDGWRPRRTILFCAWAAEEFGLMGSTEWVEEHWKTLYDRAVAYVNVDIAVEGNYTLQGKAFPSLYKLLYESTKKVMQPPSTRLNNSVRTMYDQWLLATPKDESVQLKNTQPLIKDVGSGSDFTAFTYFVGIPAFDLRYTFDKKKYPIPGLYPLYHTAYENVHMMNVLMDPTFEHHAAICQLMLEIVRSLSDSLILPYDLEAVATILLHSVDDLNNQSRVSLLDHGIGRGKLDLLSTAVMDFKKAVSGFQEHVAHVNRKDPLAVRRINDQMMKMERAFTDPLGIPGRQTTRHLIYAPSAHDTYSGSRFPGVVDLLYEIANASDQDTVEKLRTDLGKYVASVIHSIQSAAHMLHDNADIL